MEGDDLPAHTSKPLQSRDVAAGFCGVKGRVFVVWESKGVPTPGCCMPM